MKSPTSRGWSNTRTVSTRACSSPQHHSARRRTGAGARQIWQLYDAGVDALIIQAGPARARPAAIQLHATPRPTSAPGKGRFCRRGLSRCLARDSTSNRFAAIRATRPEPPWSSSSRALWSPTAPVLHQHAHTAQRQPRDCSQARLPYQYRHGKAVSSHRQARLSMKDNNQSDNLEAGSTPASATSRSRAATRTWLREEHHRHYRTLLDQINRAPPGIRARVLGPHHVCLHAHPTELQREFTDYFVGAARTNRVHSTRRRIRPAVGYVSKVATMGRTANRLARHRAQQRRRLCYYTCRKTDRPAINRAEKVGRHLAGVSERPMTASRICARARWSTATAT